MSHATDPWNWGSRNVWPWFVSALVFSSCVAFAIAAPPGNLPSIPKSKILPFASFAISIALKGARVRALLSNRWRFTVAALSDMFLWLGLAVVGIGVGLSVRSLLVPVSMRP